MKPPFSAATFAAAYCCAYVGAFVLDLPLLRYYPLVGTWRWWYEPLAGAGPSMAWYGLMASAALVALPLALLVPEPWAMRRLRGLLWLLPLAAMLACAWLLRQFFV